MSNIASAAAGCEWLASKRGWKLRRGNVMVEGTSDVSYFLLAADLHLRSSGMKLVGDDLSIFAAGEGDDGGTFGISERFPTLFDLAGLDLDSTGRRKYHAIALLDDDNMGRSAVAGITKGHRRIMEYESIFLLRRVMPLRAGSPRVLGEKSKVANAGFSNLECVIEDLLAPDFCDRYLAMTPSALSRTPTINGQGRHCIWTQAGKVGLLRFAKEHATSADVGALVGVIKALRSYVGLPADGLRV